MDLRKIFCLSIALQLSMLCIAQNTNSMPEILADTSVRFTISNPKAEKIELNGSMLQPKYKLNTKIATIGSGTKKRMVKTLNGIWSYVTSPLLSDMYTYNFIVDGKECLDPMNSQIVRDIADTLNFFIISGGVGDYYLDQNVPHGTIEKVWYPSTMPGWSSRRMSIYTPPGYSTNKRYPVLYLLHGSGGDEDAWQDMGRVQQVLDNMLAKDEMVPMIVVMPNGNVDLDAAPGHGQNKGAKPSAVNVSSMLGVMEATFIHDIVGYVDANYPTIASKSGRAIAGLSLGGLHTLYISLNNPTYFDYIGLFSAQATNAMTDKRNDRISRFKRQFSDLLDNIPLLSNDAVNNKLNNWARGYSSDYLYIYQNMDAKVDSLFKASPKLFYIALGREDFVKKLNDDLRKKLDDKQYKYTYNETEGAHTWSNWRKYLIDFLPQIFNKSNNYETKN